MARRLSTQHTPRSGAATIRRSALVTSAVGAFLSLGLTQLAAAPKAHADEFDVVVDQVLNAITNSLGDLAGASSITPDLGVDTWLQALQQDWTTGVDLVDSWFTHTGSAAEATTTAMSQNLLVNPGFETADPSGSGYSGVTIPGWTETGTPTVIAYGTQGGYPFAFSSPLPKFFDFPQTPPADGGDNFAGGGPVATSSISQTVDLTGAAGTNYDLSAELGGQGWDPSTAGVQVDFLDSHGDVLGTGSLSPVTVWDRLGFTGFEERDTTGVIPEGTTSAQITTTFTDNDGFLSHYNGAYADNESFTVGDPNLTAATLIPPTSDVGKLDHVFLIYMENKGVDDIVGSPNAPYINSLINNYGYADNYFALGHPSDPNYVRVVGGSDFGLDYNPSGNVINAPSLMQEMDEANIPWAGYEQSMPYAGDLTSSGNYAVDELPFSQFNYVYDNTPAYLQEHLLPLTQLSTDLQNPSSFPAFAWIAADEDHNMEGPIDTPSGIGQFLLSQFTNHQYNVEAGDQFVQQEVSAIENSPTWNADGEKDAIIITFDEDNNNLSLGFGNEGNNVPMIVIPNGGAVDDGGMQSGHFTTGDYYNEYSLMATIEDSLRTSAGTLAPLTDNDEYAPPMNAFWK